MFYCQGQPSNHHDNIDYKPTIPPLQQVGTELKLPSTESTDYRAVLVKNLNYYLYVDSQFKEQSLFKTFIKEQSDKLKLTQDTKKTLAENFRVSVFFSNYNMYFQNNPHRFPNQHRFFFIILQK